MNVKEKMFLLKFLYGSSKNANLLDEVFQEILLQDNGVMSLKESLENDYFLGDKGKELQEKGASIYNNIMSSPMAVEEVASKVNLYLETKKMEKLSVERSAQKLISDVRDYSVIDHNDKEILEQYFRENYKAMLYMAVVLGGKKTLENVKRFKGNDLYNWLSYFKDNRLFLEENSSDTWVIYYHNYSDFPAATTLSGYELVYYKGPAKFYNLLKEEGVVKYTPWIYGNVAGKQQNNRKILCFGIGNVTNITIDSVENIFESELWVDLPKTGTYEKGLRTNPISTINFYLGDKGELFCITPSQYVSLCNAISNYNFRRNQRDNAIICPICNAVLRDGNKICPRHCDRV